MTTVWLRGKLARQLYAYDTETGRHRRFVVDPRFPTTAGSGGCVGGRFVASYVSPDDRNIYLDVGGLRFPVDGITQGEARVRLGGLCTVLRISRPGMRAVILRDWTLFRWVGRLIDVTWDGLDELASDKASGIATLLSSSEARDNFRRFNDPQAGPWHLLDDAS